MKRNIVISTILLAVVLLLIWVVTSKVGKGNTMTHQMTTIIDNNGADPWVLKQGSDYYYTKTTGNTVTIFRSKELTNIAAGESIVVYEENQELSSFWAPEIHFLDGGWYIYFAACKNGSEIHQMYVLMNENEDPFKGTWSCTPLEGMDDKFAIDGTVLDIGNESYFIWSGWEGYENVQQNLYLARMDTPIKVREEKILLSMPEYNWEKQGNPLINEGPQIVIRGNTVNLVYSASGSWTNDYCLGLITAPLDADLSNPEVWVKEESPVFSSANGVYGPGHNSFTVSPDASEEFMIFHAARWEGAGWNRSVRLQRVEFDTNGKLLPSSPVASAAQIEIPSGEEKRYRYDSSSFSYTDGLKEIAVVDSVSKKAINGFEDVADELHLEAEIPKSSQFTVILYAKLENCYDEKNIAPLEIEINGHVNQVTMYPSEYYQPLSLNCELDKGKNTIIVRSVVGGDEISINRIELLTAK